MAQRSEDKIRHMRALARRYGLNSSRRIVVACLVVVALLACVGLARMWGTSSITIERDAPTEPEDEGEKTLSDPAEPQAEPTPDAAMPVQVVVHVDGEVASPGVVTLEVPSPRVNDAVELAGGLTESADTTTLNLAAPLADGQKIHVPAQGEQAPEEVPSGEPNAPGQETPSPNESFGRVNINTANADELKSLPGVGEATATAIVKERESAGPFTSPEDIMRVSGIGEKKFAKIKDLIDV